MASITINEISQNVQYNIGSSSYAQVALPITSCWGPGYYDHEAYGMDKEDMLESTTWQSFRATQEGLESFVSTYRGPASNYRTFGDYSYQQAMTLLTTGYDVLVCRVCPGTPAQGTFTIDDDKKFTVKAKYPGTFGNSLMVVLKKVKSALVSFDYWNIITYIVDASGVKQAVENKIFVFDIENSTDTILHIGELESDFLTFDAYDSSIDETAIFTYDGEPIMLSGGYDIVPMLTSEEYDKAYAKVQELQPTLVTQTQEVVAAQEIVDNAQEHIYKLSADLTNYNNKLAAITKVDPVDNDKKAEVEARIAEITADKTKWENTLTSAQTDLTTKQTARAATKTQIETQKATIESESIGFRKKMISDAFDVARIRYGVADTDSEVKYPEYISAIYNLDPATVDNAFCIKLLNQEWIFTNVFDVYDLLKDRLSYHPQRVISPGWDDQNIADIIGEPIKRLNRLSPLHIKLMDVAYHSRCATALLDIPKCLPRSAVYNASMKDEEIGYTHMLARYVPDNAAMEINGSLYHTHSALFAPWGQYKYAGTSKQSPAPPAFQYLMISRAMILNQSNQYEWLLPSNKKHNVKIGKPDYTVPKKLLDVWQATDGVGVNVITTNPEIGLTVWGNSTLYEVPPATYQALANLSTRYLVNAIEDVAYKCGVSITQTYNNDDAYSSFYAGVTPILDLMKNMKAIEDFYVRMSEDIDKDGQVKANSVIGKIYITPYGVIKDIVIDLIALPPRTDLSVYKV